MQLRVAFETLGEVVAHYESHGYSVRTVETTTVDDVLRATLTVAVPLDSLRSAPTRPTDVTVVDDEIRLSVPLASLPHPPSPRESDVSVTEATVGGDEPVVTLTLLIEPEAESPSADSQASDGSSDLSTTTVSNPVNRPESSTVDPSQDLISPTDSDAADATAASTPRFEAVRDESVPPYEDTTYLQTLYDECDNFREMSRHIVMDVSSETVRRYMIEADIHQPASYNTARNESEGDDAADGAVDDDPMSGDTAAAGEEAATAADIAADTDSSAVEQEPEPATGVPAAGEPNTVDGSPMDPHERLENTSLATDGLGLPAELGLHDIVDAVVSAATVHEVQRELGLEREQTRDLLEQLNLIDLVSRRLAHCDQPVSYDQVFDRLSQCVPSGA